MQLAPTPAPTLASNPAATDRRRTRVTVVWLHVALALLAVFQVAVLAFHFAQIVAFAYDLNYGEGYVLNDAVRLAHGEPIYVDLQQFPMVRSPYPPLFPWLWGRIVPFAGPELWPGRALSALSTVGVLGLIAWNAIRVRSGWPVVASVGLVAASPFVYDWGAYARTDMLALLFAIAGVLAAQWVGGWHGAVLAAVACTLAVWTKQTTITAAVSVAIALTLRWPRRGLAFVAMVAVASILAALALNVATGGEFVRHVLAGNASNPISSIRAMAYVGTFAALHLPALAAATWWQRRALTRAPSPIAIYVLCSMLAAFSAGSGGSSVNYLIEPVLALALAAPFAWRALPANAHVLGPFLATIQLVLLLHWPNSFGTTFLAEGSIGRTPTSEDAMVGAELDRIVRATAGEVIAEPAGFAVRAGRPVYVQPIDLRAEQLQGRWRPEPLVDALTSGRFALVLTAYNLFPADVERALAEHFVVSHTLRSPDGLTFSVYRYAGP